MPRTAATTGVQQGDTTNAEAAPKLKTALKRRGRSLARGLVCRE
jgi:hypothetical protein